MTFLLEAMIFLGAAIVVVPISKRLGMSVVLGYLAAGVIIGPSGIGLIGLQEEATEVMHFAEIGVVFLLFIIGLELQPKRLWVMRRLVFGLGTGQVGITAVVLAAIHGSGLRPQLDGGRSVRLRPGTFQHGLRAAAAGRAKSH